MTDQPIKVTRSRVLAYRVAAQRLDRAGGGDPAALAVLDLGVQDTPYGSARQAVAARSGAALDTDAFA
ncbi:hypothetical protein [Polymorphospora sp. NPDC050346]|uniref:hypothetical protein n=1 Tax=Polymorphospora sp. NPDC050346 TaxID=3155780 RepID=UPI0033D9F206